MDNYNKNDQYYCCFMCRRSLAPDTDNNEATGRNRFFELLYPGQVFDYFCQLFDVPWLKRHPQGYRIENEEFCQLCAIQVKDAMTTSENLRLLQLKIQSIHRLFKGIIQENYQQTCNVTDDGAGYIGKKNSIHFARLLVQCWSGCKVVVEPLKDQVLPVSTSSTTSSLIKSTPHQDPDRMLCIQITEQLQRTDQLCDHVKPTAALDLKIPECSLECESTGDESQTVATAATFKGLESDNLECTLGKLENDQWIQSLAHVNHSTDPMDDNELCEKSQASLSTTDSPKSSQLEQLEFHSCEDSPDFQSSLSSEQQEMSTDFDSSEATVSPDFQSLQTPPHDEMAEKSQEFLLTHESQDFDLPDKSQDFHLSGKSRDFHLPDKPQDFHVTDKPQDFHLPDKSQSFQLLPVKSKESSDCKESLDFQLAQEFMNAKPLDKSPDFDTLEDLLDVKPLEVTSDLKLSEQLCTQELSAHISREKSTSVCTSEGPGIASHCAQLQASTPEEDFTDILVANGTVEATGLETNPTVDAIGLETDSTVDATGLETDSTVDATRLETDPTVDATELETNPTVDATGLETEATVATEIEPVTSQDIQLANCVPENVPILPQDLEFQQGNSSPIFYLIPVTSEDGSVNHQLVLPFSINLPQASQDCNNLNEFDPPKSVEISSQVPTEISSQVSTSTPPENLASVPIPASIPSEITAQVPASIPSEITAQGPASILSEITAQVPASIPTENTVQVPTSVPISASVPVPSPNTEWSDLLQPSECTRCGLNYKDCTLPATSNLEEFHLNHTEKCSSHLSEAPGPSARFQCTICDKVYMRKSALLAHSRRSHQLNPPSVCKCGLDLRSVLNNGHFKCNLEGCEHLTFTSVLELWAHHQPECNQRRKCRRKKPLPVLECSHCDLSFNKHCFLVVHLRSAHGIGDEDRLKCSRCDLNYKECQSSTEPIQFKCSFVACTKTFDKLSQLRKHHLRKCGGISTGFSCIDCDQVFSTKTGLSLHEKKAHGHKKMATVHACQSCGKSYKKMLDLKRHVLSVHEKKFEFLCRICDAGFNHAYRFRNHMQYKHEKVKKFKCEQCDSAFISPGQLIYHKRKHTGEKDYICEACGKSFWSLPKLTQHRESIHEKVPVPCPQCHKIFKSIHHVRSHVGRTHKGLWRKWMSNRRAKLEKIQVDELSFDASKLSSSTGAKSDKNGKLCQFFSHNFDDQVKNDKFQGGDDDGLKKSATSATTSPASSAPYIDVGLLLQNSIMDVDVVEVEIPSDQV